ncbi:Uncharacterised protein [Legionella steigerwaltii]|uniref:F-box domain-containing protein n=1 Tax=Legionella steigerwaltii TaxID=460 RepID=A0A378L6J1_9GAMM|nr:F-box protein [Legionella steigerwaltii]KTD77007.1 hypothetical protein Lstg_2250 [Legionella steigerwaltii]STY22436.1 Uncharacterised protein [Legionella steigerwaltii]
MFKKKEVQQITTPKGSFSQVPDDLMYLIMFFLDVKSLNHFAMTNSTFRDLVNKYPKQIHIKICNKEYEGTYPEIRIQFLGELQRKNAELAREKRENEEKAITELKESVQARRNELNHLWNFPLKKSCITPDEKIAVGCCCTFGLIGGILVSCFTPWSCLLTSCLGMGAGGTTPLVVSRTIRCCCGKCLECSEQELATREENFDKDYSTFPKMK